jgi:hypothetical protein
MLVACCGQYANNNGSAAAGVPCDGTAPSQPVPNSGSINCQARCSRSGHPFGIEPPAAKPVTGPFRGAMLDRVLCAAPLRGESIGRGVVRS